jgi:hypothetical protein
MTHLFLLNSITLIICGEEHELQSSSICDSLHHLLISSLLNSNIPAVLRHP